MPDYLFAYHKGEEPASPEAGAESMARWQAWVAELGAAMVDPGTPLGPSHRIAAAGAAEEGGSPLIGFSVVRADDLEAALRLARACPYLEMGTIEVAEMKA